MRRSSELLPAVRARNNESSLVSLQPLYRGNVAMDISIGKYTRSKLVTQQLHNADHIELERNRGHRLVTDNQSAFDPRRLVPVSSYFIFH
jgi:hypothetical protein